MTEISKYLERFEAYQNGDLSPGEMKAFMNDLEKDNEMLSAWREYTDMMDAITDKEAVSLRSKLEEAFNKRQEGKIRVVSQSIWFRISSAAMIIVVMGALLYFFCTRNADLFNLSEQDKIVKTDSILLQKKSISDSTNLDTVSVKYEAVAEANVSTEVIASIYDGEEYQISPVYAELLHNVYRSGWFRVQTPSDSIRFSNADTLVFSWDTNIEEEIFFDILDRNGRQVYRHEGPVSSPWEYLPELEPAIYMYRFATQDQPVWMGVIVGE